MPGEGGAEKTGAVERHGIQRNGIDEVVLGDQIRDEREPRGKIDRIHEAVHKLQTEQRPGGGDVQRDDNREQNRVDEKRRLRRQDEKPLGQAVGERPRQRSEEQRRTDRGDDHQRRPQRVGREVVRQPHQRRRLHPRADERYDLAKEIEPEVTVTEGAKGPPAEAMNQGRRFAIHAVGFAIPWGRSHWSVTSSPPAVLSALRPSWVRSFPRVCPA